MKVEESLTEEELYRLQKDTFSYFSQLVNEENGLIPDNTRTTSPCSIAAVGLALSCYPIAAERSFLPRERAAELALKVLRFLWQSEQSEAPDATGYKGFYYHFLDMKTGRRVWKCEISTIDSAIVFAGMLTLATYFDRDTADEAEVRRLAEALYRRADWNWARDGGPTLTHGWRPETGFIPHRYQGYDEGLLLYVLGLGSPTYPLPPESYAAYCATYQWKEVYG